MVAALSRLCGSHAQTAAAHLRESDLGLIVLIRTVLSISIEVEIDGVAPWRKALTTGPQVLARATRASAHPAPE